MGKILRSYDAGAITSLFEEMGVFEALAGRGFGDGEVTVDVPERGLPHVRLFGRKSGRRYLLLDACVLEAVVPADFFHARGYGVEGPAQLSLLYWVREEDPTASFPPGRPALPLQRHPGLGLLRRVFRVIARMTQEQGMDGVACVPKFFHDAAIFFSARLFLFLDPEEQGRFEALRRDLARLPLGTASLALVSGSVRDAQGKVALWSPGYQVFPISPMATSYFHSEGYARRVRAAAEEHHFSCENRR